VKWKIYPNEESTWEPAEHLKKAGKSIKDFHEKHPSAPRRISALTFDRLSFSPLINFTEPPPSLKPSKLSHTCAHCGKCALERG